MGETPLSTLQLVFLEGLLASGDSDIIDLARELITDDPSDARGHVTRDQAAPLVVSAAANYINTMASPRDPGLALARACLALLPAKLDSVAAELSLANLLQLLADLNVDVLPAQVSRMAGHKTSSDP